MTVRDKRKSLGRNPLAEIPVARGSDDRSGRQPAASGLLAFLAADSRRRYHVIQQSAPQRSIDRAQDGEQRGGHDVPVDAYTEQRCTGRSRDFDERHRPRIAARAHRMLFIGQHVELEAQRIDDRIDGTVPLAVQYRPLSVAANLQREALDPLAGGARSGETVRA